MKSSDILRPDRVWQEETFKIEKSRGCQGSLSVFSIFVFFGWAKTLSYKFFIKLTAWKAKKVLLSLPNFKEFHQRKFEKSVGEVSIFSPQWHLHHQNKDLPRLLFFKARAIFWTHSSRSQKTLLSHLKLWLNARLCDSYQNWVCI